MCRIWFRLARMATCAAVVSVSTMASAQEMASMPHMNMNMSEGWQFMQDGILFAEFNHQGGPRGGEEFVAPNWWMGMASRNTTRGQFTFTSMLSLDAATVGRDGYGELFQAGEALDGKPIVDRQHPHDFFMQLSATWRTVLPGQTGFTLSGGPAGEPALGPVAFMHRASAADNPTAPLSHHTFDSSHVSFGVVTAAIDRGRWMMEGSVFNGREPDDNRWDFDLGRLDSVSGRVWFRPNPQWELQLSTGHLRQPEQLEPGNVERTTASASWTRTEGLNVASVTAGYGRNDTDHGARNAAFLEGTCHAGGNTIYGRFEALQTEFTAPNVVLALSLGGVRDVLRARGFEGGLGADMTLNRTPDAFTATYGAHPVSFRVFFRLRPPAKGRMWNMRMAQPMAGAMGH